MIKPFIKLIHYKNYLFFLYDVNKNEIISISKETYFKLANNHIDVLGEEIQSLIKRGYLQENRPLKIEQPLTLYQRDFLDNRINGVVLQVTQLCNMKCKYCVFGENGTYSRKHNNSKMSFETAKKAILFLKQHSRDLSTVRISFYGGEPLINYELIRKITLFAEKEMPYKSICFAMTTNLTLLNDDIADFLEHHNFMLTVSLDGSKEINDNNRWFASNGASTFHSVMNNLLVLKKRKSYFYNNVQINAVLDKSISRAKVKSFFSENQITKHIPVELSVVDDSRLNYWYIASENYLEGEKAEVFSKVIKKILNVDIDDYNEEEIAIKLQQKKQPFSTQLKVHHDGPCIPGVKKLFINVIGDFFPCEKANEKSNALKIGNVVDGLDYEAVENLYNIGKISELDCKNCWAIKLCSCCAVNIDDGTKISVELKREHCMWQKKSIENYLVNYAIIQMINKKNES